MLELYESSGGRTHCFGERSPKAAADYTASEAVNNDGLDREAAGAAHRPG